jgi:hypothetical protein
MQEKSKNSKIEFNEEYDRNMIDTPQYRVFSSHIKELYPLVYKALSEASLLEAYLEPKVVQFLELQLEYQKQNYPLEGCKDLAYNDISEYIKNELEDNEKSEYLDLFDLDKQPFIDTEEIQ